MSKNSGFAGRFPQSHAADDCPFPASRRLTQFMSNTAAAALLCPIGLSIAQSIGANPVSVVLAIGFACSAAYVTPVATPPNTMIYGPAGARFMDFVKVGGLLFLIVGVICCLLLPILFPFY